MWPTLSQQTVLFHSIQSQVILLVSLPPAFSLSFILKYQGFQALTLQGDLAIDQSIATNHVAASDPSQATEQAILDPWTTAAFQSPCYAVCPRSQLARRVSLSRCCTDPHFYRLPHLESHGRQKEEHQCKLPSLVTVHLCKAQFAGLGPGPFFGRLERRLEL